MIKQDNESPQGNAKNTSRFLTPFADVEIKLKEEDMWARDEIEDWMCEKCGVPSPRQFALTMQAFDRKRVEIKEQINADSITNN